MKIKIKWLIGIILFPLLFAGLFLILRNNAKSQTSIVITSISSDSPQVGDKIRINYQLINDTSSFTIIALPDTQHYSEAYPEIFLSQTQWIVENKDFLNIEFVTHLGDIVQNNDLIPEEWIAADAAMSILDDVVPYGVLPGNHDMQAGGQANYYEKHFSSSRYEDQSWWGGSFNQNKNNYQLFSAGGDEYLILHMQYCPPKDAIDWANGILQEYSERKVIISTHAFLTHDATRLSHCQVRSDGDTAPSDMWVRLIKNNTNNFLVLSGHILGVSRRSDPQGRIVYQLLANYQSMENGGNGYLRIMAFHPSSNTIRVSTYSPFLDKYLTDSENQFDLSLEMTGGSFPMGEIVVSNGTDECIGNIEEGSCDLVLTAAGRKNFIATYSGDVNYQNSSSPEVSVWVESK